MSVQQPLLGLLKQIGQAIEIIDSSDDPTDFDYHCPLMSLPLAFGTTLDTIPAGPAVLNADAELRIAWADRLPPKTKPRIGVVWSGSTTHNIYNRSMPLETVLTLLGQMPTGYACRKNSAKMRLPCFGKTAASLFSGMI